VFPEIVQRYQNLDRVTPNVIMNLEGMIDINDDNLPAPENTPTNDEPTTNAVFNNLGDNGVCQGKTVGDVGTFVKT